MRGASNFTNSANLQEVTQKSPKRLPNEDQMEPLGPKRLAKDLQKASKRQRRKKAPKKSLKKTCLSKGTGSALKGGALQRHVLKCWIRRSKQKEQSRTRKGEYKND